MIKYKCKQCNKIFCDYATNYRKFCSLKCHYLSREGIPSKRRNGKSIKCKLCNKSFYVKKSIIQKNRGIFCSKQCQYRFYKGIIKENIRSGKYIKCQICKKFFYVTPKKINKIKFCSRKCFG